MVNPNYRISGAEVRRFLRHGVAHAVPTIQTEKVSRDDYEFRISINEFRRETGTEPTHAWVGRYHQYNPEIVLANSNNPGVVIPRDAISLQKDMVGLLVQKSSKAFLDPFNIGRKGFKIGSVVRAN